MYDGVINVYKESGYTSFDVVAKLRGILHQKKIGHTGTLDPQAEGVLVVCLGKATRLCDILPDHDKEYEAVLLLGTTTDTEDMTGTVLERKPVNVSEEAVREAVESYIGTYDQIPPMYSAIKVNGQKLYDLARQGQTVERKPRSVTIYTLEILEMDLPRVRLRIRCSRGTYIRSLCRDIGEKLGCGGCMEHLMRTGACGFRAEKSLRLSEIEHYEKDGTLNAYITAVDAMYAELPKIYMDAAGDKLLHNGNKFRKERIASMTEGTQTETGEVDHADEIPKYLVYDSEKQFTGIYEYDLGSGEFRPYKMFL